MNNYVRCPIKHHNGSVIIKICLNEYCHMNSLLCQFCVTENLHLDHQPQYDFSYLFSILTKIAKDCNELIKLIEKNLTDTLNNFNEFKNALWNKYQNFWKHFGFNRNYTSSAVKDLARFNNIRSKFIIDITNKFKKLNDCLESYNTLFFLPKIIQVPYVEKVPYVEQVPYVEKVPVIFSKMEEWQTSKSNSSIHKAKISLYMLVLKKLQLQSISVIKAKVLRNCTQWMDKDLEVCQCGSLQNLIDAVQKEQLSFKDQYYQIIQEPQFLGQFLYICIGKDGSCLKQYQMSNFFKELFPEYSVQNRIILNKLTKFKQRLHFSSVKYNQKIKFRTWQKKVSERRYYI